MAYSKENHKSTKYLSNITINEEIQNNNKITDKVTNAIINYKKYYSGKAIVLTYHHISPKSFSSITIKPERFESDLKMLVEKGFNVISLRQLINAMDGKYKLPDNAVVITFDDGIESFYKYAYPLLKKYNMPSVNFIITSRTESYSSSNNDFNPLSPGEIKEMYDSGLVDFQSHTHNSHDYVFINPQLKKGSKLAYKIYDKSTNKYESEKDYVNRIKNDLATSREIIYKYVGVYPDILCFPFGQYNKRVIVVGKSVGFKYFVTTQPGYNKENSHSIKVFRIRSGDSNLDSDKLFNNIVNTANNSTKK
jgi:poly-beta-1,6-N-acetyl-D-glucosamine N-deacetylase PgaB